MKAVRLAAILLIIALTVYVLMIADGLIIPLVVAIFIWFFVNSIAKQICRIKVIPHWLALVASSLTIILLVFLAIEIIEVSIERMIRDAPKYQSRFAELLSAFLDLTGMERLPSVADFFNDFDIQPVLQNMGKGLSNVAGQVMFVIIYTIFLLLEQSTFSNKLKALAGNEEKHEQWKQTLQRISDSTNTYISMKTGICLTQAVLAYILFIVVGLDFALFWSFTIFLVNYIPTFGSLIGTLLPSLFGLLQFESYSVVAIMAIVLWALQFLMANFVEPKLMGNSLNISTMVVLISLSVWGFIWGIMGMIFSVPIMVIVILICSEFPETRPIAILLSSKGELPETGDHGQNDETEMIA